MARTIAIIGAGGFGREVFLLVRRINESIAADDRLDMVGWYDDKLAKGTIVDGRPVLGAVSDLRAESGVDSVALGVGDPVTKSKVADALAGVSLEYPVLIDPGVSILQDQNVRVAEGVVIAAGSKLTTNIDVGRFSMINLSCTVGHDAEIGEFCSVMPGVNISGECCLGSRVYVGTGASIINGVTIADGVTVGAGAVVTKDLAAGVTAVGVPARALDR